MIRTVLLILTGNAMNSLLLMIRNLLVARLISVEDYGIAATFSLVLAIIEMTSSFGLQQLLVQDKRGNDPAFQAALQGFHLARSLVNALLLFVLAGPFAWFMNVPEVTWAHRLLAVVLVMNGLFHFDQFRMTRERRYGPGALASALAPLAALLVVWPLAWIWGDYRVMLWSMIVQFAGYAACSHLVAERPYRLRLDRAVIGQAMIFGWPLLIEGLLLFAIFNGEKMIVGREYGMAPLALFTMAVTLTLTPALILQKSASSFLLPGLSAAGNGPLWPGRARAAIEAHLAGAGFLVLAVQLCAAPFVHLALGEKYAPILPLMTLLAVMQALRLAKSAAATVSLSRAQTSNGMLSNVVRVAMLVPAWIVAVHGGSLQDLIGIGIIGEALGLVLSLWLLRRRLGLAIRSLLPALTCLGGLCLLASYGSLAAPPLSELAWIMALLLPWLAGLALSPELRRELRVRRARYDSATPS